MDGKRQRKTDRRTLYTRMVIKQALLRLLAERDYADIRVADLCRAAEINRGTFYLHYEGIDAVLDALLDDALRDYAAGCAGGEGDCAYPFCRFLRQHAEYRPLFFADGLRGRVLESVSAAHAERFVTRLSGSGLSAEVLRALFTFQLNGCLAVSKQHLGDPDGAWEEIRCGVDSFLKTGFDRLGQTD